MPESYINALILRVFGFYECLGSISALEVLLSFIHTQPFIQFHHTQRGISSKFTLTIHLSSFSYSVSEYFILISFSLSSSLFINPPRLSVSHPSARLPSPFPSQKAHKDLNDQRYIPYKKPNQVQQKIAQIHEKTPPFALCHFMLPPLPPSRRPFLPSLQNAREKIKYEEISCLHKTKPGKKRRIIGDLILLVSSLLFEASFVFVFVL